MVLTLLARAPRVQRFGQALDVSLWRFAVKISADIGRRLAVDPVPPFEQLDGL